MSEQLPGVPPAVAEALERLKDELTRLAGPNLAGLLLYGGLARGRYRPGQSDVNVVVLLHDASGAALSAVTPALREAWRAVGVDPLLMTPAEIPHAADAFPTKFLDIKNHHILLAGADPFSGLEISREQIRLRVEQELRNLLMRLRHRYVSAGSDAEVLTRTLVRAARPFALQLAALLQFVGKETPTTDRTAEVFAAAATAFGLEREPLARLAELRQNPALTADVPALYVGVLEAVARAADIADRTKEPPG
jgi:hypothetical protein